MIAISPGTKKCELCRSGCEQAGRTSIAVRAHRPRRGRRHLQRLAEGLSRAMDRVVARSPTVFIAVVATCESAAVDQDLHLRRFRRTSCSEYVTGISTPTFARPESSARRNDSMSCTRSRSGTCACSPSPGRTRGCPACRRGPTRRWNVVDRHVDGVAKIVSCRAARSA